MHLAGLLSDLLLSLWPSDDIDLPHNIAEKINTGYKTWELIAGFQIICQHPQVILGEWELEFEEIYYQCHQDRLHFIHPCAHQVNHLITEAIQKGPQTIGNLGQEIRQPAEPYTNLSREGVRRSQVNLLKAMLPELDKPLEGFPTDCWSSYPQGAEKHAITLFLDEPAPKIFKWACLKLPNGQIAHSHCILQCQGIFLAADLDTFKALTLHVCYFTQLAMETIGGDNGETEWSFINVAVISLFSLPDNKLLELFITDVVAMVPHHPRLVSGVVEDHFFMVEKPGLDVASFGILPVDDAVEGEGGDNDSDDGQ
ncbi:hypothetical protein BDR03DRAFT_935936 [Suillus americanus]|nr:hypothetical protein BDR03DRAFT_935936 [Suillus americanus]